MMPVLINFIFYLLIFFFIVFIYICIINVNYMCYISTAIIIFDMWFNIVLFNIVL